VEAKQVRALYAQPAELRNNEMANMNYRQLNQYISQMSEEEVFLLLQEEIEGKRRLMHLQRLHQRYNSLRVMRERYELLALADGA